MHLIILFTLSILLLASSLLKNACLFLFYKSREKEKYTIGELIWNILGNRIVGLIWILPYKILDKKNYDSKTNYKEINSISFPKYK